MSGTGGAEKNLDQALSEASDQARRDQGEQQALELGDKARAIAEAAGDIDEEQLDQLGLPAAEEILEIQRELDCTVHLAVREHRRRAGKGGRKKGSRNKRTEEFRRLVLASGGHPGLFLQRIYDRPTELLAEELGCSKREALDRQIRAADTLMPFIEGKQPVSVNLAVRGDMVLSAAMGTGLFDDLEDLDGDDLGDDPQLSFSVENQPLIDMEASGSE